MDLLGNNTYDKFSNIKNILSPYVGKLNSNEWILIIFFTGLKKLFIMHIPFTSEGNSVFYFLNLLAFEPPIGVSRSFPEHFKETKDNLSFLLRVLDQFSNYQTNLSFRDILSLQRAVKIVFNLY